MPEIMRGTVAKLLDSQGDFHPVPVQMHYNSADPYAVRFEFFAGPQNNIVWTFSRELIRDGLSHPSGENDVKVQPTENGIEIILDSPSGRARIFFDVQELKDFLEHSESLCPPGREHEIVEQELSDEALAKLLLLWE